MPRINRSTADKYQKTKLVWFLLYLLIFLLVMATASVQLFPDRRIVQQSQKQYWANVSISATRGNIIDRNNIPLAVSKPVVSFFIDPKDWDIRNASILRTYFGVDIEKKFSRPLKGRFHWVKRNVESSTAMSLINKKVPGLYTYTEKNRIYPNGSVGFHILGFCDVDNYGQAGIEHAWNNVLYSPPKTKFRTRGRKTSLVETFADTDGMASYGNGTIKLTIDSQIQQIVETRLSEGAKSIDAKWAAAVCINPHTGEVIAMASYPTIDANLRKNLLNMEATRNNVIGRVYEPGSIFKPITMSISLDNAGISKTSTYSCSGRIRVADKIISDVNHKAHGIQSLTQVLMNSCNIGMSILSMRVSNYDAYGLLKEFGFGEKSEIEMSGEESGLIKSPEEWLGTVPANIFIGQGIAVTPLQLVMGISCIANGGELLKPYVVSEVIDSTGKIIHKGSKRVRSQPISSETASFVRSAMEMVVSEGGGKRAKSDKVKIAGKTGTAQIANKGIYQKGRYVASFVGFWPADKPEYVLLVSLGEPQGSRYYGGLISAPVFKSIVEDIIQISPEK
ncbi:MAG: penicillin-binding protein 2 [Synergistaceae bacterium]